MEAKPVFVPAGFTEGCSLLGITLRASQSGVEILHSIQLKMRTHARLRAVARRNRIVGGPDVMDAKPDNPMGGG
jgi:hypothetical protein